MPITFILSDESVNCYGYRVLTGGIELERFLENPVMLYSHDSGTLPIGRWENVRVEGMVLYADACFDEGDPFAQEVRRKVDECILRCCSIGFMVETVDESPALRLPGQTGPTVTRCELLECSVCAVGANRNARTLAAAGGIKAGDRLALTGDVYRDNKPKPDTMIEQEQQNQIGELQAQVQQLTADNEALRQQLAASETNLEQALAEVQALHAAENESLLDAAVADGRIGENDRSPWAMMLDVTPESARKALAGLSKRASLSQMLENGKARSRYAGKTWSDLDREGLLAQLKHDDPETFKALYREKFGADYRQ